jgi:hypothetical protein
MKRYAFLLFAAAWPSAAATAQTVSLPGGYAPGSAVGYGAPDAPFVPVTPTTPLPTAPKQEAFTLVAANEPAAPVVLYGGSYVLTQGCASYGAVTLRYRGPDGGSMVVLATKTAADAAGGTVYAFGSNAYVDAAVSGTTGCNVQIARLP